MFGNDITVCSSIIDATLRVLPSTVELNWKPKVHITFGASVSTTGMEEPSYINVVCRC